MDNFSTVKFIQFSRWYVWETAICDIMLVAIEITEIVNPFGSALTIANQNYLFLFPPL